MKRKLKQLIAIALIIVTGMTFVTVFPSQAAKRKAVKVVCKRTCKNNKQFMTIKGLDSKKKVVWKYVTNKYTATEVYATKCVRRKNKNKVYVFDGRKVVLLRKTDGKKLWTAKASPAGHKYKFDSKENLYITGFYDDNIYKISAKGKRLWKTNVSETKNYRAKKIYKSGNNITISYEANKDDTEEKINHKVVLDAKTGKILKYL